MLRSMSFFRPKHFRLLLASSLSLNALALALPLMTMQIYDRVLANQAVDTLLVLSCGVIIAACMEFVLKLCRSMIVGINGVYFEHEAATEALQRVMEAEPRNYQHILPSTMLQDLLSTARLKDYFGGQMMVTLIVDIPFALIFIAISAYLAKWLVVVPIVMITLFLFITWRHGLELRKLIESRETQDNDRYNFMTSILQVIHTVKAFCLEAVTTRHFEEIQRRNGNLNYRVSCMQGYAGSINYAFAQLMSVAMLCAGAPMVTMGYITVGTLIACVLLSGQIMQPLQRGLAMWIRFQDIALAKERLGNLLAMPARSWLMEEDIRPNLGGIVLKNVSFGYMPGQKVLDHMEVTVSPGKTISITGLSGSGKTTLLELMAGIYQPVAGRIMLAGMDVHSIPPAERAKHIAYLPASGLILRGNIMDNLTGFNQLLRPQARIVAGQLGVEEAVSLLPAGYDTPLEGNATDVISPGLKQRIAIARALLHKPRLILFDNADQGMDQESYDSIFTLMTKLRGKTSMVLISEDQNIMSLADEGYMLTGGKLVQITESSPLICELRVAKEIGL